MKFKKVTLGLLLIPVSFFAQQIQIDKHIPIDESVRVGKLKNGLTYYIKHNEKPQNKVDLRLIVNAGSNQEADDQQGLAHFMEHMAFNGTKNFPKNQLVDYLQSIGVKFGQHLNAYTSFDETVYFLPIPSDDPVKLNKGFQILSDWAFNVVLTPEEIEKERGVVLEEYRIGQGAQKRMQQNYFPKLFYKSQYANRLPIGKKEILENFKPEVIQRFYNDWYRPDLMAIVVVGDINVDEIEKKIIKDFSKYKNPKKAPQRKTYELPNHSETFVAVETDTEMPSSTVQLIYKDNTLPTKVVTEGDMRDEVVDNLFSQMLNARLQEKSNSATPPFIYGFSYHGNIVRAKEGYQSVAASNEGKQLEALKALVTENARVKKFGFTQEELDRAKSELLIFAEKSFTEKDKQNSSSYVGKYQQNFLTQTPIPSTEWNYDFMKKVLPTINLNDVNDLIKKYIHDDNRVVILTGPEKEGVTKPSEAEVLNQLVVNEADITPYNETKIPEKLVTTLPTPGKIVKREENKKLGTKSFTLSNGAKVTYKNTDFKNDEILFHAVSKGGTNLLPDETYLQVSSALSGITEAGVAGLNKTDLSKYYSGKFVAVAPYVSSTSEGFSGQSTVKDLPYLFEGIYAYVTNINYDPQAFKTFADKNLAMFKNILSTPSNYFNKEMADFTNKDNKRYKGFVPTASDYTVENYAKAFEVFKKRFENIGDFEFFFVGNIDEKQIESLATQYLATLPSTNSREKIVDTGARSFTGEHKMIVNKGVDQKSNVVIRFTGETPYDANEALAISALGEILTIKLVEELRENESGVYGVSARGSMNKYPYGTYSFQIGFPCGPENAEKLTESALRELNKIIAEGPTQKDLDKYKEGELLDYKKDIKENRYWLNHLASSHLNDVDSERIFTYEQRVNNLTVKDLQDVAKKYLTKSKFIGILMPESTK
jgi:zinc protease